MEPARQPGCCPPRPLEPFRSSASPLPLPGHTLLHRPCVSTVTLPSSRKQDLQPFALPWLPPRPQVPLPQIHQPCWPQALVEVWRQAEGPFKGGNISSVMPEPPNHNSPPPDSAQPPRSPCRPWDGWGGSRKGQTGAGSCITPSGLWRQRKQIWTGRPWLGTQTQI